MKVASTVRRGAVGKVPKGNSLAAYPTMEQVTKHVEGQFNGQKTTSTQGRLQVPGCAGSVRRRQDDQQDFQQTWDLSPPDPRLVPAPIIRGVYTLNFTKVEALPL